MIDYVEQSALENRFWLQIMGDHARFIFNGLAPSETEAIETARGYIAAFDGLLSNARMNLDSEGWIRLAQQALPAVQSMRVFQLELLKRSLYKAIESSLFPSFFNGLTNELDEYLCNLGYLAQGLPIPVKPPVHNHMLWIFDAIGHSKVISGRLDPTQASLRMIARDFEKVWSEKYLATVEFAGFMRTGQTLFPSLGQFDKDVNGEMCSFREYLEQLKVLVQSARAIGSFDALIPDHMAREECYYLLQLHMSDPDNTQKPSCDPARPRIE